MQVPDSPVAKIKGDVVFDIRDEVKGSAPILRNSIKGLEIIRHDMAHILAQALLELFPGTRLGIGPIIEDGFYYDAIFPEVLKEEDLTKIERKMQEIVKAKIPITREVWSREKALEFFKNTGQDLKVAIIQDIPGDEKLNVYKQGEFVDLCRGPHAFDTGIAGLAFKLHKLSGSYFKGDAQGLVMQRIYGTGWLNEQDLANYLTLRDEAEKRDHRKLGPALGLFHLQEEAKGSVFWHPEGWTLFRLLEDVIRQEIAEDGYVEVRTPQLVDRSLWEASGHWDKFGSNMFTTAADDERPMAFKPMNCPCHVQIFKQGIKSYRDLPLRMAEFGCCHRNESSGSLHGLLRVRSMVQDDAHIFCTFDQINSEAIKYCKLLQRVYAKFGFKDIKVRFSTRPKIRAGEDAVWDKAEESLAAAASAAGLTYVLNPGEGAFYGPKLEFVLKDSLNREWQCGTLQVDMVLPERLGAQYTDKNGEKQFPVMLHRAVIGTLERFIGILLENSAGWLPWFLAPVQVALTTISEKADVFAKDIAESLKKLQVRFKIDLRNEKISLKIREWTLKKIPLILIVGEKEAKEGTISWRTKNEQGVVKLEKLADLLQEIF